MTLTDVNCSLKTISKAGTVAHVVLALENLKFESSLGYMVRPILKTNHPNKQGKNPFSTKQLGLGYGYLSLEYTNSLKNESLIRNKNNINY